MRGLHLRDASLLLRCWTLDKPIIAGHGASLLSFPQPEQQSPGGSRLRVVQSGDPIAELSVVARRTPDAMSLEVLAKLRQRLVGGVDGRVHDQLNFRVSFSPLSLPSFQ